MPENLKEMLLDAALRHVTFEGWSAASFDAAVAESRVEPALARAACPRGAIDLAVAYHQRGDQAMLARLEAADLGQMRFRDRVAAALRFRLEVVEEREAVRRSAALFALPHHAPEGARLIWGTADLIWDALGDTSRDLNWYTKRATLSAVYGATFLFWLGDTSPGHDATWAFLDRRIGEVMEFEKFKAKSREAPLVKAFLDGPGRILERIRAPGAARRDLPGRWSGK